jgi:hypothetical protein
VALLDSTVPLFVKFRPPIVPVPEMSLKLRRLEFGDRPIISLLIGWAPIAISMEPLPSRVTES